MSTAVRMTVPGGNHADFNVSWAPGALAQGSPRMSHAELSLALVPPPVAASHAAVEPAHNDLIRGLFIAYSGALRGYIRRRVKNEADVAELVQEVYVRLMRRQSAAKLREAPESYLFRTAINLIRDQHRRNTARSADRHIPFEDELADSPHDDPEALLASRQLSLILEQAIRELDPKAREVFSLRLIYELSYREIEARTGIALRSIERYMSQALDFCSDRVAREL